MKKTKPVIQVLLIAIIIFLVLLLPMAIFSLSLVLFIFSKISYLLPFVALSLVLSFAIIKNRTVGATFIILLLLFLSICMFILNGFEKSEKEEVIWNSPRDRFTVDFVVGGGGLIYVKAVVNDTAGLFLFDTGCDICFVNEKFVTDETRKLPFYTIRDVKGIEQTKDLYKVKYFELGPIKIKRMHVYPADSLAWIDPRGIHYKQDSVLGIIGINFISKFIWDFDLIRKQVTVSKSKTYCKTLPDSQAFHLVSENNHKEIVVQINGENKQLALDFGSTSPISISDSIPDRNINEKKVTFSGNRKGLLSHLDTTDRMSSGSFVDVKLGAHEYKNIACYGNDSVDLLGIPFVWSFERVVLDFMHSKAYFIGKNDTASNYGVHKHNRDSFWNATGIKNVKCSPEGWVFKIFKKDSTQLRYVFYGNVQLYNNNDQLDSICCHDSLRLPDGRMKQGPFTIPFSIDR